MDSGLITTLAAAVVGGSTLGATIAGFFAYRRKARITLQDEIIATYEKRVKQLEEQSNRQDEQITQQTARIAQLEAEKALPLENLIKLITSQHSATLSAITKLTKAIAEQQPASSQKDSKNE